MKRKIPRKRTPQVENYLPLSITIGPHEQFTLDIDDEDVVICECGAEKVKTTHSDWCPKYRI